MLLEGFLQQITLRNVKLTKVSEHWERHLLGTRADAIQPVLYTVPVLLCNLWWPVAVCLSEYLSVCLSAL